MRILENGNILPIILDDRKKNVGLKSTEELRFKS